MDYSQKLLDEKIKDSVMDLVKDFMSSALNLEVRGNHRIILNVRIINMVTGDVQDIERM